MLNVIKWLFELLNAKIFKTLGVNALNMLSFTSIRLNPSNYAQWALVVVMFLLGRKKFDYVISEPLVFTESKYADWRARYAQIWNCLWNSMEYKINSSLVFPDFLNLFHFEEMWLLGKGCSEIVEVVWSSHDYLNSDTRVVRRIGKCGKKLKRWS